jgi:phosphoadenosine phosphosulfate reductase
MGALLTYDNFQELKLNDISVDDDTKGSLKVLKWAYEHYGDKLVYACSFGIEGIVLIDLISKVNPSAEVVFLDTDLHFKETYELIEKMKAKYPKLNIRMIRPELSLEEQEERFGANLWERRPNQCCHYRKIVPLEKTLAQYDAWISGLRREQSETRKNVNFVNKDERFQSVKICPLIHWTWDEIWDYVKENDLPYNTLHDEGYPSIGCAKCTWKASDQNDLRSGRWINQEKTECGLHQ